MNERQEKGKKRKPESNGGSRNLRPVWQKRNGVVQTYRQQPASPEEPIWAYQSMQRAAVSVPANVAEGFNRYHNKEYRFCTWRSVPVPNWRPTLRSTELKYLDDAKKSVLLEMLDHESRMLTSLIGKLA